MSIIALHIVIIKSVSHTRQMDLNLVFIIMPLRSSFSFVFFLIIIPTMEF